VLALLIRLTWRALLLKLVRHDVLQNFAVLLRVRKRFLHSWQVGRRSAAAVGVAGFICICSDKDSWEKGSIHFLIVTAANTRAERFNFRYCEYMAALFARTKFHGITPDLISMRIVEVPTRGALPSLLAFAMPSGQLV